MNDERISEEDFGPTFFPPSNISSPKRDFYQPFGQSDIAISASIIIPMCLFGLVANLITMIVIIRSSRLKSAFNHLLISLCLSDLVSALISPFFLYRRTWGYNEWAISTFLCKTYWGLEIWTSYVTSAHIFLFALFRYISVKSATDYHKITSSLVKKVVITVWILMFFIGFVPFCIMFYVKPTNLSQDSFGSKWPSCTLNDEWLSRFIRYCFAAYGLIFYIPMLIVLCLALATVVILLTKRKNRQIIIGSLRNSVGVTMESKRRKKERQVMLQLFLIVVSFFIGYIPQTAYHFFTTSNLLLSDADRRFDWWFGVAEHMCLRFSECLNPIFYNMASKSMRKETFQFIKTCCIWRSGEKQSPSMERGSSQVQNIPTVNGAATQGDNLEL